MKLLFVCAGNTCRSPMLQFMMADYLKRKRRDDIQVDSAGLTLHLSPMSDGAVEALKRHKIPFTPRFSSYIDRRAFDEADMIFAVTDDIKEALDRAFYKKAESLSALGWEIPDPFGKGEDAYEQTFNALRSLLPKILKYVDNSKTKR